MTEEERRERDRRYYQEHKERKREQKRNWYHNNKEKVRECQRLYMEAHREERKAYNRRYYQEHKEKLKAIERARYQEQKEEKKAYQRAYTAEHREEKREKDREYRIRMDVNSIRRNRYKSDPEYRATVLQRNKKNRDVYNWTMEGRASKLFNSYRDSDSKRHRYDVSGNVTPEWIMEHIFTGSCVYCGDSDWRHLGADRIDNSKPHTPDNVVCSCGICNIEREHRKLTVEEFREYRKTHPRKLNRKIGHLKPYEVEVVNGVKVLKKKVF